MMLDARQSAGALYERLVERDLEGVPAAAFRFAESNSVEQLFVAVARFAVLAYAPSQHGKRSVIACSAVDDMRNNAGERWIDLIVECARYAAESRPPWSEPPLLEKPEVDPSWRPDAGELRRAVENGDRERAEQWLAARIEDADDDLRSVASGDALLVTDAVLHLAPRLGEKGRYALLRIAVSELVAGTDPEQPRDSLEDLIRIAIQEKGSIAAVRDVLVHAASLPRAQAGEEKPLDPGAPRLVPYRLARDYAQVLIAHAAAKRLPHSVDVAGLLRAVHENLEHGDSYADWSFA